LLWLESPEVLHNSLETLWKLTSNTYLKPGDYYYKPSEFNPEILKILDQKGIRYDKVPQKEKTVFVKNFIDRIWPHYLA
jgi:hypothetical protein